MTLAELFQEGAKRGIIDWTLRADCLTGLPKFYIHGSNKSSATLDFTVDEAIDGHEVLVPNPNNANAKFYDGI